MNGPLLLAIDPATRATGWAVCDLESGEPVACGSWDVTGLGPVIRHRLYAITWRHLPGDGPAVVYVEGGFGGGRNARAGVMVAEAAGQLIQAVDRGWPHAPVERLAPAEWKRLVGLKGNATRDEYTARALQLGWEVPTLGRDARRYDTDAAAAACIATAGHRRNTEILERAGAA